MKGRCSAEVDMARALLSWIDQMRLIGRISLTDSRQIDEVRTPL